MGDEQIKTILFFQMVKSELVVAEQVEQIIQALTPPQGLGGEKDLHSVPHRKGHLSEDIHPDQHLMPGRLLRTPGEDGDLLAKGNQRARYVICIDPQPTID